MTAVTTHVYTAVLAGAPDQPLALTGGSISLDASRRPHVEGTLTIALPSLTVLAGLDPRLSPAPRIVVDVDATFPSGVQARSFDLTLRDRTVDLEAATVTLAVASDEALLGDYAPLADDPTPLNFQASLRGLVGYVLGKVIPGAVLGPGADVAVPALAESSNLIRNPRAGVNAADWQTTVTSGGLTPLRQTSGGPADAPTYMQYLSNSGVFTNNPEIYISENVVSITTGKQYVISVYMGGAGGRQLILDAVCFDASGNITGFIPAVTTTMVAGVWKRVATAPFGAYPNTAKIRVRVRAVQVGGSEYIAVTGWRLSETTGDLAADARYFDGDTADTTQYDYAWAQTAHASIATRKVKVDAASPDALTWQAGQDAMAFLAPIVQRFGLRLVCDEQRVWTLRDEDYTADGSLDIRHAVNLINGSEKIARADRDWFDAAAAIYTWTDRSGTRQERIDAYAENPDYTLLRPFEFSTPYPGPGFAEYAVRRAQGRGRQVSVTTVADWTAAAEQPLAVRMDGVPIQTGKTNLVTFTLDTDEMTVTSRTTDTPEHAWVLQAEQPWTAGPAGQSWTEAP